MGKSKEKNDDVAETRSDEEESHEGESSDSEQSAKNNYDDDDDDDGNEGRNQGDSDDDKDEEASDYSDDNDDPLKESSEENRPKKVHKLSLEKTKDFNEILRRRGVIYVARVPPRMTPTKLKTLLGQFGEITRVYLVEEDKTARKRRRQRTGNGAKRYTEGWVEFVSKKVAKHVALSLNTTPISNHKRNVHYGDLWNLKYLSKFKWMHLTEKVAYERRVREQKLRLETLQARKETAAYKQMVETGQKLDKIAERRRKRAIHEGKDEGAAVESVLKKSRKTKQLRPLHNGAEKSANKAVIGSLL